MSTLSRINIISRFLNLLYGDFWSKWQGAIIFKTLVPFVFLSIIYLWYSSIRNAFGPLNLITLSTMEPWIFISGLFFLILFGISFIILFFTDFLSRRYLNKSIKKMLNDISAESNELFKLKERMQVDLSRKLRLSLIKTTIKTILPTAINMVRYVIYLLLILIAVFIISFICSIVIHFQIIHWIYQNLETFTIFGSTISIVSLVKDYLVHPVMVLIYPLLFLIFLGFTGTVSANLERKSRNGLKYSISTLLQATNIVNRFAIACSITLYCIFVQDVREISQEVTILSHRDLQESIAKNMGKNQEICQVILHYRGKVSREEDRELKKIIRDLPEKFKKIPKWFKKAMAEKSEKEYDALKKKLEKNDPHIIFAVTKEGCKFLAIGEKIFPFSVKYTIWCEDFVLKNKIIEDVVGI